MSQLGLGVMINMLGGNKSTCNAVGSSIGKKIDSLAMKEDRVLCKFEDGTTLQLWDDGQSCCEQRFMTTDDGDKDYRGQTLRSVELREAPEPPKESEWSDEHEVQFLVLKTDKDEFVVTTHNVNNGYYGGFSIVASVDGVNATE